MMIQGKIFKAIYIFSRLIRMHICFTLQSDLGYLATLEPVPIQILSELAAHESYAHTQHINMVYTYAKNVFTHCYHICNKSFTVHIKWIKN